MCEVCNVVAVTENQWTKHNATSEDLEGGEETARK